MARKKKKKKKRKPAVLSVRRTWTRNPVQRAHSTTKGAKGYDRQRDKQPPDEEEAT